ncbi:carbohydrate porin [Bradyrhizobium elkanii]|uniref:Carbohydrate porin n=1 Tax=Bradyrhizobium elkanii TaxID=29448 RepID=A0A4U6RJ27_BRAEL|nr:carbohydrate porin [Bradyrhizobium elkanii]
MTNLVTSTHVRHGQQQPCVAADHVRFRPTTKQSGLAIALSIAACLVGNPSPTQAAEVARSKGEPQDEAGKRTIQSKADAISRADHRHKNAAGSRADIPVAVNKRKADNVTNYTIQKKPDPFAKFANLREKGLVVSIPGPADTVVQDAGGVRSALAELGIGYLLWSQVTYTNNLLPNAAKSTIANQLYNGQNPTFNTVNYMWVTYDLSRYGIPDGQIVVGAEEQSWTWQPGGPDRLGINTISYYQTLWDKKVELKLGYLRNSHEFAGTVVGGNAGSNVFGPSSSILFQGGLSAAPAPTPALNLKYNFDDHLYTKVSFQRADSPDGLFTQITENPTGLNWSTAHAGVLYLDETGYLNKAAPGSPQTWLRAGAGYNTSSYKSWALPNRQRTDPNTFYYIAADRQFWQTNAQDAASRGIYAGFSVMGAPPDLNTVSQYYELRFYVNGPFDWRPTDQFSVVATNTVWSKLAVDAALAKGNLVHWDSKAIAATYTAHLAPGIYTSIGLTYINNPTSITYIPQIGHALNFSVSTNIFF